MDGGKMGLMFVL